MLHSTSIFLYFLDNWNIMYNVSHSISMFLYFLDNWNFSHCTHSPTVLNRSFSSHNSSFSYTPNSQPTVDEAIANKKNINIGPRNLMDVSGREVLLRKRRVEGEGERAGLEGEEGRDRGRGGWGVDGEGERIRQRAPARLRQ